MTPDANGTTENPWRTAVAKAAREAKRSPADLLALSPGNDPFYVGSHSQVQMARWFAGVWRRFSHPGSYLRGMHYAVATRADVKDWKGGVYRNTDRCWNGFVEASKYARYLGLVPMDAVPDHKAHPAVLNAHYYPHEPLRAGMDLADALKAADVSFRPYNPRLTQPFHQEVWIEKSSMEPFIGELCRRYGVNLIQGEGQLSITAVQDFVKRLAEADRPGRVYYVSDFDPQGATMPTAISRKIEFLNRNMADEGFDCKLKQIALTREQAVEYRLPRTPIKETDMGRAGFEERHGEGATELDALQELHPGVLGGLLEAEFTAHFDADAWNEVVRTNERVERIFQRALAKVVHGQPWKTRPPRIPDRSEGEEDGDEWLYDSERDYSEQLRAYRNAREGTGGGDDAE